MAATWTIITIECLNRFDSKGWLNLWVDGKLVVRDNGANAYHDHLGGYLSLGNYKYPWRNHKPRGADSRLHYIDDVNVYVHSFRR